MLVQVFFLVFATFFTEAQIAGFSGRDGVSGIKPAPLSRCSSPVHPINGRILFMKSYLTVGFAIYECYPGYTRQTQGVIFCQLGKWNPLPTCNPSPSTRVFRTNCDGKTNCVFVTRTNTSVRWTKEIYTKPSGCGGKPGHVTVKKTVIPTLEEAVKLSSRAPRLSRQPASSSLLTKPESKRGVAGLRGPPGPPRPSPCHTAGPTVETRLTLRMPKNLRGALVGLEIGAMRASSFYKYYRFVLEKRGRGLAYLLHVAARCLPDPPSHIDQIGSANDENVALRVDGSSFSDRKSFCINLKDTVTLCNRFVLSFKTHVIYSQETSASLSVIPQGRATSCPGEVNNQ